MKIHDATENIEKQEKKHKITRSKYQDIENKYHPYDKLSEVITNEYKGFKGSTFTVRTSKELTTSLRVYSEAHNISISESIKTILEKYFQDHTVARTFFKLEKPFTVAIPLTLFEIEKYIDEAINCIIYMSSDIDSRLAVQRQLISNDETDYYLAVTFTVGNNYLDIYHEALETYYSVAVGHHIGLFDIYLDHLEQSVFVKVTYDGKHPIDARLITKETAYHLADECDNQMLITYLDNLHQANCIIDFKERVQQRETYIKTLEAQIQSLENEISNLKDELAEQDAGTQEQSSVMQDDSNNDSNNDLDSDSNDEVNLSDPILQVQPILTPEQEKIFANTMAQMRHVIDLLLNLEMFTEGVMKHPAIKDDKLSEDENKSNE